MRFMIKASKDSEAGVMPTDDLFTAMADYHEQLSRRGSHPFARTFRQPLRRHRKPLGAAVALNSGIFVVEAAAGYQAGSLSLIMDSTHNFFNSVGLIAISGLLLWHAAQRLIPPALVQGTIVILTGLLAAGANWGNTGPINLLGPRLTKTSL